jgi:hypothetical protein
MWDSTTVVLSAALAVVVFKWIKDTFFLASVHSLKQPLSGSPQVCVLLPVIRLFNTSRTASHSIYSLACHTRCRR